jgi:hypothetical protein
MTTRASVLARHIMPIPARRLVSRRSISLAAASLVALAVLSPAHAAGQEGGAVPAAPRFDWFPGTPAQGRLFVFRVVLADGQGSEIRRIEGRTAGERLHFRPAAGEAFEALAPAPIDARGTVEVTLDLTYANGQTERVQVGVPVEAGSYRHERLTVAPRFGSPPNEADQRRRARDAALARAVSEAAHRTPRLWTPEVILPRDDRVTSGFGNGREFNGQISSRHMGLDLDGEPGDTVYAAIRGVVELVDEFLLAGNIVYLNHGDGLVSGYFHLSRQLVAEGDTVTAGTPIGLVGATGRVTGPHLHWVVRHGYVSVDPRSLLEVMGETR